MKHQTYITVFYHIFYEDTLENICAELEPLLNKDAIFLFNICSDTPGRKFITKLLKQKFAGCYIISTTNKGKDIGGKLALMALFLQLKIQTDIILLLHDKKSLQALKSNTWKKDLMKIISAENITRVLQYFDDQACGIVATNEYKISEHFENGSFTGTNSSLISIMLKEYKITPPDFSFVAGTMFWLRAKPFVDFFMQHNPLQIRGVLEAGNVLDNFSGTLTHSWERAFSWIVTSKGYFIKGI